MNAPRSRLAVIGFFATACCVLPFALVGAEEDKAAGSSPSSPPTSSPSPSPSPLTRSIAALHTAVSGNLDYCDEWLAGKDYKTLAVTAEGVQLLADALRRFSDGAQWKAAGDELRDGARGLQQAAKAQDAAKCKAALMVLRERGARFAKLRPGGKPAATVRPSASLRSMMSLLDGTFADAKASLAFGEAETAKSTAIVLAELGRVVSNYRNDERWSKMSREMIAAALETAEMKSDDPKAVRVQLRGVYQRCEACHNRKR